jgi:hypothetical protein
MIAARRARGLCRKRHRCRKSLRSFHCGQGFREPKTTPRRIPDRRWFPRRSPWEDRAGSRHPRPTSPFPQPSVRDALAHRRPSRRVVFCDPSPPQTPAPPETRARPRPSDRAQAPRRQRPGRRGVRKNPGESRRGEASHAQVGPCGPHPSLKGASHPAQGNVWGNVWGRIKVDAAFPPLKHYWFQSSSRFSKSARTFGEDNINGWSSTGKWKFSARCHTELLAGRMTRSSGVR